MAAVLSADATAASLQPRSVYYPRSRYTYLPPLFSPTAEGAFTRRSHRNKFALICIMEIIISVWIIFSVMQICIITRFTVASPLLRAQRRTSTTYGDTSGLVAAVTGARGRKEENERGEARRKSCCVEQRCGRRLTSVCVRVCECVCVSVCACVC